MAERFETLVDRVVARTAKVAVIGAGRRGLQVMSRAVRAGFPVVGFDTASERIELLRSGRSTTPVIGDHEVAAALGLGLEPTGDPRQLHGLDVAVVAPPAPDEGGADELRFFAAVGALLAPDLRPGVAVLVDRTGFAGTAIALLGSAFRNTTGIDDRDYILEYAPEHPGWDPDTPWASGAQSASAADLRYRDTAMLTATTVVVSALGTSR